MKANWLLFLFFLLVVESAKDKSYEYDFVEKGGKNFMVMDVSLPDTPKKEIKKAKPVDKKKKHVKKKIKKKRKLKAKKKEEMTKKQDKVDKKGKQKGKKKRKLMIEAMTKPIVDTANTVMSKVKEFGANELGTGIAYGGAAGAAYALGKKFGLKSKYSKLVDLYDEYRVLRDAAQKIDEHALDVYFAIKGMFQKLSAITDQIPKNLDNKEYYLRHLLLTDMAIGDTILDVNTHK